MTSISMTEDNFSNNDYYDMSHVIDSPACSSLPCIFVTTAFVIICILGIVGNGLVIWIAGFKVKKSVNTTWYLSLAVSDFLFCFSLSFIAVHDIRGDWIFGLFMCKFVYSIPFLTMFSNMFILTLISVDRCAVVVFPVWAQNQRTIRKASVIVTLVWIISAVLSTPSLIFADLHNDHIERIQHCYIYMQEKEHIAIETCRFVFGFLIPFLIIIICYSITMKMNQCARFMKPFKIMTALNVTFFICWLPFHTSAFMYLNYGKYEFRTLLVTYVTGITLSSANHCVNPFIYAFMGRDAKIKWYGFPSKIENALVEEDEDQNAV